MEIYILHVHGMRNADAYNIGLLLPFPSPVTVLPQDPASVIVSAVRVSRTTVWVDFQETSLGSFDGVYQEHPLCVYCNVVSVVLHPLLHPLPDPYLLVPVHDVSYQSRLAGKPNSKPIPRLYRTSEGDENTNDVHCGGCL